jgi:hypothetical protein
VLEKFVVAHRHEIIVRCRHKVSTRSAPPATPAEIEHGVPVFLDQLLDELRAGLTDRDTQISNTAAEHGHDLLVQGFTPAQVVHDYGDVCQVITEMITEKDARISADDFRMLNRCLDDAIAAAITQYEHERDLSSVGASTRGSDRLRALADAARASIMTAQAAFQAIRDGQVGYGSKTGMALGRSLEALAELNELLHTEIARMRALPSSL